MQGFLVLVLALLVAAPAAGQTPRVLDARMHHLRQGDTPEWADFPARAEADRLVVRFPAPRLSAGQTLRLRQEDVRQEWEVTLNGRTLGTLTRDENPMIVFLPVPDGALVDGENTLVVAQRGGAVDDVRVGEVVLFDRAADDVLTASTLDVAVRDEHGAALPARITIAAEGALQPVGWARDAASDVAPAVRPGFVYTASGDAAVALPAGTYTVYAGRGFEYGVDSVRVSLGPGEHEEARLAVRREVPTEGWVAADTHVHTVTHSGHGDATVEERALTLAGEGIELPVLTDHDVHADLGPTARKLGLDAYFTPVVGNEVTTRVGHFNVWPLSPRLAPPDPDVADWQEVAAGLDGLGGERTVILNHARDVHAGFRPFGPARHVAPAGLDLDGWVLPAGAMEVLNSSAQLSDPVQLFHDWFGLLNRGLSVTPVGSSDSHDVGRYLVGQGRTYVLVDDRDPGAIDVAEAARRFRQGAVMVSFGLLAELTVDGTHGPGDLVPARDSIDVSVRVLGPGWARAQRVALFANGVKIHEATVRDVGAAGEKERIEWRMARPAHDVFLVAVAEGPARALPFWPVARPYQTTSPDVEPRLIGASGAVWVDADGDGRRTSARAYAESALRASRGDVGGLMARLAAYDEAVAIQAASLLHESGADVTGPAVAAALRNAAPATRAGFARFSGALELSRKARTAPHE